MSENKRLLNDNLISVTDRKGQITNYTYDNMDRIIRADYADAGYTEYTYDAIGRLDHIFDSVSGQIQYVYGNTGCAVCGGALDRVIQEITPLGSISYTYDDLGRRTSMTVAGQEPVTYQYDTNSRLTDIDTFINGVAAGFSLGYDPLGRRTSLTYPNGVTTNYTYGNASRLLNLEHLNPLDEVLESLSYTYDANGNRISSLRDGVEVKLPDPASNINYNSANQMLSFNDNDKTMAYDENGNMTSVTNSCGTTTYIWDVRDRLVGIEGFDPECLPLSASFKYDALGRRIEKTVNDRVVQYLYDGMDIVQEIEDGIVTVNYIRTLNIDEPLLRITHHALRFYQTDALGSIIALTDEVGIIKTQYNYSPFGATEIIGEWSDNPFQYTGRENDETGLYYYRARYYSPELQRFISEDPIRLWGGDINYFAYVQNNPVNWIDPLGLTKIEEITKGPYRFEKYPGDRYHGGKHWHVKERRTGKLLGRLSPEGKVLTGSIPKKALKILTKLGKIGGIAIGILLELADPSEAGGPGDMVTDYISPENLLLEEPSSCSK